jgi:hypothetical protein
LYCLWGIRQNSQQLYKSHSKYHQAYTQQVHIRGLAAQLQRRNFSKEFSMSSFFKPVLISAVLACAGFAAFAQMHGDGPQGMQHPEGCMHGMRANPEKMQAMHAKHLAELKAKLKITAAQEGAWTTFTAAMQPAAHPDMQRPERAEMEKLSTPERMDAMRKFRTERMTEMNANMDKHLEAVKVFYGTLTPEQKKVFDSEHSRIENRMEGRMQHRMEHNKAPAAPAPKQ